MCAEVLRYLVLIYCKFELLDLSVFLTRQPLLRFLLGVTVPEVSNILELLKFLIRTEADAIDQFYLTRERLIESAQTRKVHQ